MHAGNSGQKFNLKLKSSDMFFLCLDFLNNTCRSPWSYWLGLFASLEQYSAFNARSSIDIVHGRTRLKLKSVGKLQETKVPEPELQHCIEENENLLT